MKTGVAYLAVAGTAIIWSAVAGQLVTRVGVKPVLVVGMTMLTAGLLFFTQVSVGDSYVRDLLPGFLIIGVGIGFSFVPISISALAGVKASEAGLASGLINTSQQIGGAPKTIRHSDVLMAISGRGRKGGRLPTTRPGCGGHAQCFI
jgi:MFS family permease